MNPEFVHLHVHSEYSLLDGLPHPAELAQRAKEYNQPALALTDHGTMFAAIEFHDAAKAAGVKPIIGLEAYLAARGMKDRDQKLDRSSYHLLLLAENETGYHNLMKLATAAQLEGFYYYPRVDKELLSKHSKGIIATSGCLAAEIPQLLVAGKRDAARQMLDWYRETFKDRFYIELQDHHIADLKKVNQELFALAEEFNLKTLATNDVHYLQADDWFAQDILLCIQTNTLVNATDRMRMDGRDYYFKSTEEMAAAWSERPDALKNTIEVAERCTLDLTSHGYHLPNFPVPNGYTAQNYLRALCEQGLATRYENVSGEVRERFEYELRVIHQMGFDTYFLIVWDLTRYAHEKQIWYNVRGSAASSIVAYCLGITNLDPLQHRLVFERFLNPGRISMPDIDLDFPDDAREEMIRYTVEKYGKENVAQIITFGKLLAKAALRDVGRALDYPLSEVDRVAKLVPLGPGQTIENTLENISEFRELYESSEYIKKLVDNAKLLEGVARHASTHAAGVVVADKPIVEYTPLHRPTRNADTGFAVTQYPMGDLEHIGLLKIDFLGLATLTIMRLACELIEQRHGVHFDLTNVPVEDDEAFRLLSRGDVVGVFQLEGAGMRRVITGMKPTKFDHIVAAISLFRPGPMDYIPTYIKRMHGEEKIEYAHPSLEHILAETYGVMVYQEQILRIAMDCCGYSGPDADLLRKAVGKKKKEELLAQQERFVNGAMEHGNIPQPVAEQLFEDLKFFARYGFNKAHAADYAVLTCQTAYLKAHYPREYMTALFISDTGNIDKIAILVAEARRMGILVLPPDIRYSNVIFTIDDDAKGIRFALSAIKNVGAGAVEIIVNARREGDPFTSLDDFCRRVDLRQINRRVLESLIKAGAFDGFGSRAQLLKVIEQMLAVSASAHQASAQGQMSFFGSALQADTFTQMPRVPELDNREKLESEKELMGVYFSEHPLLHIAQTGKEFTTAFVGELNEESEGHVVTLGGIITAVRSFNTKKGDAMAFFQLEDPQGTIEVVAFPRVFAEARELIRSQVLVLVSGKVQTRDRKMAILADSVRPFALPQTGTEAKAVASTTLHAASPTPRPAPPSAPTTISATLPTSTPRKTDEYGVIDDWLPPPEEMDFDAPFDSAAEFTPASTGVEPSAPAAQIEQPPESSAPSVTPREEPHAQEPPAPLPELNLASGIKIPSKTAMGNGGNRADSKPNNLPPARYSGVAPAVAAREPMPTYATRIEGGRVLRVRIRRSSDAEDDIRRMRELIRLLRSAQGPDRFSLIVPNSDGNFQLDFPNYYTDYAALAERLDEMISEWGELEIQ